MQSTRIWLFSALGLQACALDHLAKERRDEAPETVHETPAGDDNSEEPIHSEPADDEPVPVADSDDTDDSEDMNPDEPEPLPAAATWGECVADGGWVMQRFPGEELADCEPRTFDLGVVVCDPDEAAQTGCEAFAEGRCCWPLDPYCDDTGRCCMPGEPLGNGEYCPGPFYDEGEACLTQGGRLVLATLGMMVPPCADGEQALDVVLWCDSWGTGFVGCDTGTDTPGRCCLPGASI